MRSIKSLCVLSAFLHLFVEWLYLFFDSLSFHPFGCLSLLPLYLFQVFFLAFLGPHPAFLLETHLVFLDSRFHLSVSGFSSGLASLLESVSGSGVTSGFSGFSVSLSVPGFVSGIVSFPESVSGSGLTSGFSSGVVSGFDSLSGYGFISLSGSSPGSISDCCSPSGFSVGGISGLFSFSGLSVGSPTRSPPPESIDESCSTVCR